MNALARCGVSPKAFRIRPIADRGDPEHFAIDALEQWAASSGVSLQCRDHDFLGRLAGDRRLMPGARLIGQPVHALVNKPLGHLPIVVS